MIIYQEVFEDIINKIRLLIHCKRHLSQTQTNNESWYDKPST